MSSSPRHSLVASVVGTSLTGDGLLVRLRSTLIGLLGLVAAVGLGLVAVIAQIGWPSVTSGPLPDGPVPAVVRNDTIAAPPLASRGARSSARVRAAGHPEAASADGGSAPSLALATSHQAGSSPPEPSPPTTKPSPPSAGQPPEAGESSPAQVTAPTAVSPPSKKEPPAQEPPAPSPPATASDSPGRSGESHGGGPPPWAPAGSGSHGNGGEHGKPD